MAIDPGSNSATLFLLPGMTAKFEALDHFVWEKDTVSHTNANGSVEERELVHGFVMDNEDVGDFTPVNDEVAVYYTHKKFSENVITFYSRHSDSIGKIFITAVPIHDHSSIVTGGPAYGTYFTDDETSDTGGTS
jgi:outer membrane receptor for ferrienterochelin and colicin